MTAPAWTFIPDVLDEHLEELAFLWGARMTALRSPRHTRRSLMDLEERIQAHLQGVLAVGSKALPRIEISFAADDPFDVFAAAFSLLHTRDPALQARVFDAFSQASGPRLHGLTMALSHGPLLDGRAHLTALVDHDDAARALAAADVLARRNALQLSTKQLDRFLRSDDPATRAGGWRVVAQLQPAIDAKIYAAAMRDDDAGVRSEALYAGAWCGERGILGVLRQLAREPVAGNFEALRILAVLGSSDDVQSFMRAAETAELGPVRFQLLGAFGHPKLMDLVLEALSSPDPATAAAAGEAFERIAGLNVETTEQATVQPAGPPPDEFEAEFQEQVVLPDPARAQAHWDAMRVGVAGVERLCRGVDMSRPIDTAVFETFDMESRWATWLRSRFHGSWKGSPVVLEAFPQG
jgi:uncharacterized protein (TIGR02270 family)